LKPDKEGELMENNLSRRQEAKNVVIYTFQEGDTLFGIAKAFQSSALLILEANPNLHPYTLSPGQKIKIPIS
jgi:LysM repeat protein